MSSTSPLMARWRSSLLDAAPRHRGSANPCRSAAPTRRKATPVVFTVGVSRAPRSHAPSPNVSTTQRGGLRLRRRPRTTSAAPILGGRHQLRGHGVGARHYPRLGRMRRSRPTSLWDDSPMGLALELVAEADPSASASAPARQLEFDLGLPPKLITRRPRRSNGVSLAMQSVAEFHMSFDLPLERTPQQQVHTDLGALRVELLREEFEEFKDAVVRQDVVAVADALGDIVYVAYGAALTYGIDLDAVLREVHRANMSKLGPDGEPVLREDGKVLKPPSYVAPDVRRVLLDQPPLFLD